MKIQTVFRLFLATLSGGSLFLPAPAQAWGPEGHSIVCEIAETRLTPATKRKIKRITGKQQMSDYEFSSWADIIRGTQEWKEKYPNNGKWHYIDLDVFVHTDTFSFDEQDNIVNQIERFARELAGTELTKNQQRDALRFLVHFVGDLHQPFHCAFRYGDVGGNMIPVNTFRGEFYTLEEDAPRDYPTSIHSIWDEAFVYEIMANRTDSETATALAAGVSQEDEARWVSGDVTRWALDSHWLARKHGYRWDDGKQIPFTWKRPGMDLDRENYIDARIPIVQTQLQKGGIRLAFLLNTIFDPKYTPPPLPEKAPADSKRRK